MVINVKVSAQGSEDRFQARVAALDENGEPRFGYEAEVFADRKYGSDQLVVEVGQGSIGYVSIENAKVRAQVYAVAVEIAQRVSDNPSAIAALIDGMVVPREV
jgi:hypothetical protein